MTAAKRANPRVIAAILFVLIAVTAGGYAGARGSRTGHVWAITRTLAPGTVLVASDLKATAARLPGRTPYVHSDVDITGKTLTQRLVAGELVPVRSLGETRPATTLNVALPAGRSPDVQRGDRVRLYLSSSRCPAVVVLADVTVQEVQRGDSGALTASSTVGLILRVDRGEASRVVTAQGLTGAGLRAAVLTGPADAVGEASLARCGTAS